MAKTAKVRTNVHYVNNKEFLAAMVEYRNKVLAAKAEGRQKPRVPNYIGECFVKIANHLAYKANFINYTYRDEMVGDGIENCLMYFENFDVSKSSNPFAYFTQIIYFAFLRRIQKEKKQLEIKNKIIESKKLMRGSLSVLPDDMLEQIVNKYKTIFKIKYVLKDWILKENLIFDTLSKNPNAIDLLKNNETKLYWPYISRNPNAIEILKKNTNKIDWKILSGNPNAIELLENKILEENSLGYKELYNLHSSKKIDWFELSKNPKAIKLIKKYKNKIDWKIDWKGLSENPNAIKLLEKKIIEENEMDIEEFNNLDYSKTISRNMLSSNPKAVGLLIKYDIIDWKYLSKNPTVKQSA